MTMTPCTPVIHKDTVSPSSPAVTNTTSSQHTTVAAYCEVVDYTNSALQNWCQHLRQNSAQLLHTFVMYLGRFCMLLHDIAIKSHLVTFHMSQLKSPPNVFTIFTLQYMSEWVSEQILNSTSAQLAYTVPFTLVHAWKYRTEDKLKTDNEQTKHDPEKANNIKHSRKKLAWFSRVLWPSARQCDGLILQRSWAHTGLHNTPQTSNSDISVRSSIMVPQLHCLGSQNCISIVCGVSGANTAASKQFTATQSTKVSST